MCGFVGVCATEGEGVVAVGFGWIVEGAVIVDMVDKLFMDFCDHIHVLWFVIC